MNPRLALLLIALGLVLRGVACASHETPRGDVVLDVGVARSLAAGEGFASGFERGVARVAGDAPRVAQDLADQHPPLWPLLGALFSFVAGSAFGGLKLASLLAGLATLLLVWRVTDRLVEGVAGAPDGLPALATALVATSFVAIDASGNGSLYAAQGLGVLLLVERLAAPRVSVSAVGLLLGLLLLLNHQCAVLLPVPVLVLTLAAPRGARRAALLAGLGALAVALVVQLPWWWRNALAFGSPLHSVNGVYLLWRAGAEVTFGVEDGGPVLRLAQLSPALFVAAVKGWLAPNLLYVFTTGLFVWPGLLGVAAAGLAPALGRGCRQGDRRLLAVVVTIAVLLAVAVLWPATKLRYLVALVPLVVALGVALLARVPGRVERGLALLGVLAWLAAVVWTKDDWTRQADDPRPLRFVVLAAGGALVFALPLLMRLAGRASRPLGRAWASGLLLTPLIACLPLLDAPRTAYHGTWLVPDFFGRDAETAARARDRILAAGWDAARAAGARVVAGPVELLAWEGPRLIELPTGLPSDWLAGTLDAYLARGAVDHVLLLDADAAGLLDGPAGADGGTPPRTALDGRLVVVDDLRGCVLLAAPGG